jgi:hypothetical protein
MTSALASVTVQEQSATSSVVIQVEPAAGQINVTQVGTIIPQVNVAVGTIGPQGPAGPTGPPGPAPAHTLSVSDTAPTNPAPNDVWIDTSQ